MAQESINIDDTSMQQDLDVHYQLSNSRKEPVNIYTYIRENQNDPAFKGFIPKLKDHFLGCLLNRGYDGDTYSKFTEEERNTVHITGKQIYHCKTIHINYTVGTIVIDQNTGADA
jgi:hypothetical protein